MLSSPQLHPHCPSCRPFAILRSKRKLKSSHFGPFIPLNPHTLPPLRSCSAPRGRPIRTVRLLLPSLQPLGAQLGLPISESPLPPLAPPFLHNTPPLNPAVPTSASTRALPEASPWAELPPPPAISVLAPKEGGARKKLVPKRASKSKLAIGIDAGTSTASGCSKENRTLGRSHGHANINNDVSDDARRAGATSKKGLRDLCRLCERERVQ
ncbi:hypothetical protein CONPUDRAFT_168932 [Coniophora puteana RWD-64-598 SS2]|uniref:Uncharacterized protein n=1 Tax=Coniophora puteana (strain RWD-64-598) TaxID=741705 RepID=A0A5M3MAX6_CONPW|nr:uncharacterized protein CONPUDRAFT_168932 [Coniophora puteana RWD-64-598 SS2]EIW76379.1 hypothetical protein CONPUDRAFT_168932 [Coniophora puteana RWD-64-598 SS2]